MADSSLVISIAPAHADSMSSDLWVHLEQITPTDLVEYASLADLHRLWMEAATGKSAQLLRANTCPVEFIGSDINIYLGFYAWPSSPALAYSLSAALGSINEGQKVEKEREFSAFIDNRDALELDFYLESVLLEWETPVFDEYGAGIPFPSWTVENGISIKFSSKVFGGVRISGRAIGFHHVVMMTLSKEVNEQETAAGEDPYPYLADNIIMAEVPPLTQFNSPKISSLENTITATWMYGTDVQTEQLRLVIPKCVAALLAMCPDMYQTITLLCQSIDTLLVYYNACKGEVIKVVPGDNPTKYCTKLATNPGVVAVANPWGVGTL